MTGAIAPIRPIRLIRRQAPRPQTGPRDDVQSAISVSITVQAAEPHPAPTQPPTNVDAHLIAQEARVRGLRGGQKVLETARHTYLETEWSGVSDRRLQVGRITKTDV
jgi:hypothetical protein